MRAGIIAAFAKAACAVGLLLSASACVVVAMSNYAVPIGAQSASLTFEMGPDEALSVSQTMVFVNDDIAMTKPDMPAVYALHNGLVAGPGRTGNQFPGRPNLVEAGHKLFVLAKTNFPGDYRGYSQCRSQVSFAPIAGHAYTMRHVSDGARCALIIVDRATGVAPPDLQDHDAMRVNLPIL